MFIWATLPEGIDTAKMLDAALDARVAYVPGAPFFAEAPRVNTLRLSFATVTSQQIRVGLAQLGSVIAAQLDA